MTFQKALAELLARVAAARNAPAYIAAEELDRWPAQAVAAMKAQKLLARARPATSLVCPGCERQCVMPVNVITAPAVSTAFVVCDKRSDINRVAVDVSKLDQWQASADSVADLLAALLDLRQPSGELESGRWDVGMLRASRHSAHVSLVAGDALILSVAGHSIAVADVLELRGDAFTADKATLIRFVDEPAAGGGDVESAAQRRDRLRKRVAAVKAMGDRSFLKTVAAEEGISTPRLKQLLDRK